MADNITTDEAVTLSGYNLEYLRRLIRSKKDVGIVAILDKRLLTRGYGRRMLDALPSASRCNSLEELREFWLSVDRPIEDVGPNSSLF